ncbi:MAG: hypothetical protein ACREBS_06285 [Nitrososphaerales archaeon]
MEIDQESATPRFPSFRSAILSDIFCITLKNLELGQIRSLLHKEIVEIKGPLVKGVRANEVEEDRIRYELSAKLVRICLYYDSGLTMAHSILEKSASLVNRILSRHCKNPNPKYEVIEDTVDCIMRAEPDLALAQRLAGLYPSLKEFAKAKEGMCYDLAEIIGLMESRPSIVTRVKLAENAAELSRRMDITCDLVQAYLKFTNEHLSKTHQNWENR